MYLYKQGFLFAFCFRSCARSPMESITSRVREIGETFCRSYTQSTDEQPGSHIGTDVECVARFRVWNQGKRNAYVRCRLSIWYSGAVLSQNITKQKTVAVNQNTVKNKTLLQSETKVAVQNQIT